MFKRYGVSIGIAVLLVISCILIYQKINPAKLPENLVIGTGRMDGDIISLNARYLGRIQSIKIDDGDSVKKGETVALQQSSEYLAQEKAVQAEIAAAKDDITAMQQNYVISKKSFAIDVDKAQKSVHIFVSKIAALTKNIATLRSNVMQDKRDYKRLEALFHKGVSNKQKIEHSELKLTDDSNTLGMLLQQKLQLQTSLGVAKDDLNLAKNNEKSLEVMLKKIQSASKRLEALRAKQSVLQITIRHLQIVSPIDGFVLQKVALVGEVIPTGGVIATLIDPKTLYLKMFVDTLQNGRIKIGDKAVIFLDSAPNRAIAAKVVSIAQQAEFTPKEVSVRSDRIQRVYAVHLKPLHVDPLLKLGIPAVGVISTDGKGLPTSLHQVPSI
jgi:HlyD family secretion protein